MEFTASFQWQGLHNLSFLSQHIYINVVVQPVLVVSMLCSESIEDSNELSNSKSPHITSHFKGFLTPNALMTSTRPFPSL